MQARFFSMQRRFHQQITKNTKRTHASNHFFYATEISSANHEKHKENTCKQHFFLCNGNFISKSRNAQREHMQATICFLCNGNFISKSRKTQREHTHATFFFYATEISSAHHEKQKENTCKQQFFLCNGSANKVAPSSSLSHRHPHQRCKTRLSRRSNAHATYN